MPKGRSTPNLQTIIQHQKRNRAVVSGTYSIKLFADRYLGGKIEFTSRAHRRYCRLCMTLSKMKNESGTIYLSQQQQRVSPNLLPRHVKSEVANIPPICFRPWKMPDRQFLRSRPWGVGLLCSGGYGGQGAFDGAREINRGYQVAGTKKHYSNNESEQSMRVRLQILANDLKTPD